jgi:hypothetical protein
MYPENVPGKCTQKNTRKMNVPPNVWQESKQGQGVKIKSKNVLKITWCKLVCLFQEFKGFFKIAQREVDES